MHEVHTGGDKLTREMLIGFSVRGGSQNGSNTRQATAATKCVQVAVM